MKQVWTLTRGNRSSFDSKNIKMESKEKPRSVKQTEIDGVSLSLCEIFVISMHMYIALRLRKTGPFLALHLDFFRLKR